MSSLQHALPRFLSLLGWLPLLSTVVIGAGSASAQRYTVTLVRTLRPSPTLSDSLPRAINNYGQVIGYSDGRAFLWENGKLHDLGPGSAFDINDAGQIAGVTDFGQGQRAVVWANGRTLNLGALRGTSIAYGINSLGQVVGESPAGDVVTRAFLTAPNRPINPATDDLGALPKHAYVANDYSTAWGVNAVGQVIGDTQWAPVMWNSATIQRLEGLARAVSINDAGQIVGYGKEGDLNGYGYRWENGRLKALGRLRGATYTVPFSINNAGQVVGRVSDARAPFGWSDWSGRTRNYVAAFLYSGGVLKDLNDLIPRDSGWVLYEAYDINDRGQIVGWGVYQKSPQEPVEAAFLLTPVGLQPLPARPPGLPPGRVPVFRPSTREWILRGDDGASTAVQFGGPGDQPVAADYLGTGKAQIALFRPGTRDWFIRNDNGGVLSALFGAPGDLPVPADYLGLKRAQIAVFRPGTREWLIRKDDGTPVAIPFGGPGDLPIAADYLGLGRVQIAVYRPGTGEWFIRKDDGSVLSARFGGPDDQPVPADYLGLWRAQIAVYRPASGDWLLRHDQGQELQVPFGTKGDVPVPGDYQGTGRTQIAVYRPASSEWFLREESGVVTRIQWGIPGDQPVSAVFARRFGILSVGGR